MKKFTIISLMLVLVASMTFAAGLTPYVKSSDSIKFTAYDASQNYEVEHPFLTSMVIDGTFKAGLKDASGKVDVYANIDVDYFDTNGKTVAYEKGAVETPSVYLAAKDCKDAFVVVPSLNAQYFGDNLRADLSIALTAAKYGEDIFAMNFGGFKNTEAWTVKTSGVYATALKNSSNIVKAGLFETVTYEPETNATYGENYLGATTKATVDFYVPKAGVTAKNTMADKFDTKTKSYIFRGNMDASYAFNAQNGNVVENNTVKAANFGLDYFKYLNGGFANLNGTFNVSNAYNKTYTDYVTTYVAAVNGEYKYTATKGANDLDVFKVDAKAGVKQTTVKDTKTVGVTASATVDIPRLIPVELIDNMSFNLPMEFVASFGRTYADAEKTTIAFSATAYPVYIEFAKAFQIFNKTLETLTVYTTYGNKCSFVGDEFGEKTNNYNLAAGLELGFDYSTFAVDWALSELAKNNETASLLTLSYGVSY